VGLGAFMAMASFFRDWPRDEVRLSMSDGAIAPDVSRANCPRFFG
jgi:hypothetical protein